MQSEHLATATPDSLQEVQTMMELTAANNLGSRFPPPVEEADAAAEAEAAVDGEAAAAASSVAEDL